MTDEHAFPQDWATGLQETVDWNDAGAFANHVDHPNLRGYVEAGYEFDIDFDSNLLQVSEGKAFLYQESTITNDHREDGGPDEKDLQGGLFVGQEGPSGDLTLTDGDINYVFLGIDQQENDKVDFHVNTTDTAPPQPFLRLGRIDTTEETYIEENRLPSGTYRRLRISGATHGEEY